MVRCAADLEAILAHSLEQGGELSMRTYLLRLNAAFQTIGEHPEIGHRRDDIGDGIRTFPVEAHIVAYLDRRGTVVILRILHHRQDLRNTLTQI